MDIDARMSTLFVSHGAPDLLLGNEPAADDLRNLPGHFPRPSAIVVVSAHWIENPVGIGSPRQPQTIHDFSGFDPRLYQMTYPVAGDPELSQRVSSLLNSAGITNALHPDRGLDHGAWMPLTLMYPQADIPVVQVSLPAQSLEAVVQLGQALSPLRDDQILIMGSGGTVHNLRLLNQAGVTQPWVIEFEEWLRETIEGNRFDDLFNPSQLPDTFTDAHPSIEHFAPLLLAWAAAGQHKPGKRLAQGFSYGNIGMSHYRFDG